MLVMPPYNYSWIPEFSKGEYGSACIFDSTGAPKPAYYSLLKVLQQNDKEKSK
jgi:GH35 family endo-1,4-beta-xylanase